MKHTFIIFFLFIFNTSYIFSQENKVDSILKEYQKCKVDTSRIDLFIGISEQFEDVNPEKAISYAKNEITVINRLHDTYREVLLDIVVAESYARLGKIAESLIYLDTAYRTASKFNYILQLGRIELNIGVAYADVGNQKLAKEYYLLGLNCFKKLKDTMYIIQSYVDLSDAYYHKNQPDSAIYYLELAKPLSFKMDNYELGFIYINEAESYYRKKNYSLAKDNVLKSLEISKKTNDLYLLSGCYLLFGKIDFANGELVSAKQFVKKGLELAKLSNIRENLVDAYDLMSTILEKQNNATEALVFKNLFVAEKDSVLASININLSQAYEFEKQDKTLAELKTAKLQEDAELKKQRLLNDITILILSLVVCITTFVVFSRIKLKKANQEKANQNKELIQRNEQIKHQAQDIQELNNIKDRLFSIIAHDLRSPFNNLRSILDLLVKGVLSPERFQKLVPELHKGVTSTFELLENLLHWSKTQLKGFTINPINFEIHTLAEVQLNLFEKQVSEKQIEIRNEISKGIMVFADKDMIDVVLRNLVGNAIKFCHPNGLVTVSSVIEEENIKIVVADTGIGMSEENINKIFKIDHVFTTLGTNDEKGTGLGLMLCKDFIEKNKGDIGVTSIENQGSRFWFTLKKGGIEST